MPQMPGMPQGMPGMGGMGGGMPDTADLQKLQEQLPPGMQDMDLSNLDFEKAMKRMGRVR